MKNAVDVKCLTRKYSLSASFIKLSIITSFLEMKELIARTVVFLQLKLSSVLSFLSDEEAAF